MLRWIVFGLVGLLVLGIGGAFADTGDPDFVYKDMRQVYKTYTWDWEADAGGNYSSSTSVYVTGYVEQVLFNPDSGTSQPSANYDIYVVDAQGADLLNGDGENQGNVSGATSYRTPLTWDDTFFLLVNEAIGILIQNAGAGKAGVVTLKVKE